MFILLLLLIFDIKSIDIFIKLLSNLFILGITLATTNSTSTTGSNKTDLTTSRGTTLNCGSLTNMLMVTTTVRMFNGVHSNTTYLRPAVTLNLVFVVGTTGLQDGFVDTTTTSYDTDHSTVSGGDNFLGARGQLDTSLLGGGVVGNDGSVVARGTSQTATITGLLFQVADDGTFRHLRYGHNITDLEEKTGDRGRLARTSGNYATVIA